MKRAIQSEQLHINELRISRARLHLTGFAIPTDAFRVASDPRQERRTGELLNKSGASTSADDEPKIDQLSPSSHRQRPVNMTSESGLRR